MSASTPIDGASNCKLYTKEQSHVTSHPTIQSSIKVTEMQRVMPTVDAPDVRGHPMSMSKLSMLSTAITEEENLDHVKLDTDVM